MAKILKCVKCSIYTLKKNCPNCNSETTTAEPAKFSADDKYAKYRRLYKKTLSSAK